MLAETKKAMQGDAASALPVVQPSSPFAIAVLAFAALYAAIIAPQILSGDPYAIAAAPLLAIALITLSAWDVTTFRLPDVITLPLIVLGVAFAPADATIWRALSAAIGGGILLALALAYKRVRHRDGLGLGDVKLFAAAGAWVGLENLSSVLLIASLAAIAALGAKTLFSRKIKLTDRIAFGPFLALGLWTVWLYKPIMFLAI